MYSAQRNPLILFVLNFLALFFAYYLAIFLHESGHGVAAWLYGVKHSPFDIQYEGWFFMNANENVDYDQLIRVGRGTAAGVIGIAGPAISFLFTLISFLLLGCSSIQRNSFKFSFTYWFLIVNMIPLVQYFSIYPFAAMGDTAELVRGMQIPAWCVFIVGTFFVVYFLQRIFRVEIIKAYAFIPVKSVVGQNLLLLATLSVIFLLAYMHGYYPFIDRNVDIISRSLAIVSIALVPVLFVLCNPSRKWVRMAIEKRKYL